MREFEPCINASTHVCDRSLRSLSDRAYSYRQCAHRIVQLAVRVKNNGRFIQRFDDTDTGRSKQEFADSILYDLHWLGIFPDTVVYQSKRFDRYAAAVEQLKAHGAIYPCYETAEELDLRRKVRLSRKQPPVYGREALALTDEQKEQYEAEGRKPHWRFLLPNFISDPKKTRRTPITWTDIIRGEETVDLSSVSDPVLVREDGTFSTHCRR